MKLHILRDSERRFTDAHFQHNAFSHKQVEFIGKKI